MRSNEKIISVQEVLMALLIGFILFMQNISSYFFLELGLNYGLLFADFVRFTHMQYLCLGMVAKFLFNVVIWRHQY